MTASRAYGGARRIKKEDPFHGLLLVDKPSGLTSHDVVDKIRRHFAFRKVGHGGTLDPMATGLLIILLGRGTKLSQQVMGSDKTYEGVMHLGVRTDSGDRDGRVISEQGVETVSADALRAAMRELVGDQMQIPPMYSAVKKDGVPLYKLARRGEVVERKPRLIHVYEFRLLKYEEPRAGFILRSTKGTYVRTLCEDVGTRLGCGAFLEQLRRTQSGALKIEDAVSLNELLLMDLGALGEHIIPLDKAVVEDIG